MRRALLVLCALLFCYSALGFVVVTMPTSSRRGMMPSSSCPRTVLAAESCCGGGDSSSTADAASTTEPATLPAEPCCGPTKSAKEEESCCGPTKSVKEEEPCCGPTTASEPVEAAAAASCCGPTADEPAAKTTTAKDEAGCCDGSSTTSSEEKTTTFFIDESLPSDEILKLVAKSYANTVTQKKEATISPVDSTMMGYSAEDLQKAGDDANLGLGCGNPLSFANVKQGETLVDLGSGAGIDCFIASDKVGETGKVIGVDMTPEMIQAARSNAKKNEYAKNVEFRLGEIEYLPVADNSVDVVISNCVINLSPDKQRVFHEIYRILKDGGRIAVSDVVTRPEKVIPEELKTAEALSC